MRYNVNKVVGIKGQIMKKLIILAGLTAFIAGGLQAFAVVDTDRLLTDDYLLNQGYSPEMVRMMKTKQVDPYAPHKAKETPNTPVKWFKRFYQYVDPATDNQRFGDSIIDPRLDRPSQIN